MRCPRLFPIACGVVVVTASLAVSGSALSAEHYVRAAATGDGSGSDWQNAAPELPVDLVRGDVYYVAAGDYDTWELGTPAAGTEVITIKKATGSEHGAATDWQDAYGAGAATFSFLWIKTSYWTVDGVTGSGADAASYGFSARTSTDPGDEAYVFISAGNTATFEGITVRNLAATCSGPGKNVGQQAFLAGTQSTVLGATLDGVYADNCSNSVVLFGDHWLIENSYFGRAWSSAEHHGEQIDSLDSGGAAGTVFRNNVIAQCAGTTCIGNGNVSGWQIYGNVFRNIDTGNGVIGSGGSDRVTDTLIVQNTIVDNHSTSFLYQNNPGAGQGSGNVVQNNLFYDSNATLPENGGGPIDHDYNAVFGAALAEPNGQTLDGDPFVDLASYDLRLKAHTSPGLALGPPYDVDALGSARSNWDRGAYEFCETDCAPPPTSSATTSTGAGGASSGSASGGGGATADGGETNGSESSCGCRLAGEGSSDSPPVGVWLAACAILIGRRRSRSSLDASS